MTRPRLFRGGGRCQPMHGRSGLNPMLPGNVPINEQIERPLGEGRLFVACYAGLD